MNIHTQLDRLRDLKDGWMDGQGKSPPIAGLDWLAEAFRQHFPSNVAVPTLYPTEEGGIAAEWTLGENEISLDIDLTHYTAHWHRLNTRNDDEESVPLNLNWAEDFAWLAARLRRYGGEVDANINQSEDDFVRQFVANGQTPPNIVGMSIPESEEELRRRALDMFKRSVASPFAPGDPRDAKIAELEAKLAQAESSILRTADGVPIRPEMRIWVVGLTYPGGGFSIFRCSRDAGAMNLSICLSGYSTEEAAQAAADAINNPKKGV